MRFSRWQWAVLILPIAVVASFLLIAASWQINAWRINWIWAIFILLLVGWRWLLVHWTATALETPLINQAQTIPLTPTEATPDQTLTRIETEINGIVQASRQDVPAWQDWPLFWQRCQQVVTVVAQAYYPDVKYPLLNIYLPDAYGLIRGTVDDMDRWIDTLSPTLNQVSIAQVYQSYEVYQKLEPSLRKIWRVWNWSQWVLNPAAAARYVSRESNEQATQQLLVNLSQQLREATLRTLCRQAIALYSPTLNPDLPDSFANANKPTLAKAQTQTLKALLAQRRSPEQVEQQPVKILLVGRTGAGKSSLINALFQDNLAITDLLPSTTEIAEYQWQTRDGESLALWDSPGYEQDQRSDLREVVLDYAQQADVILLLNPALDPALQMDADFLKDLQTIAGSRPILLLVTQVDRLRPVREWQPPYDWQNGEKAKEKAIREAVKYRSQQLGDYCRQVLPIANADPELNRPGLGLDDLSLTLLEVVPPAKQQRLARFLNNLEARAVAAAQIIDRYALQMTTTQGVTALLKSPVLQFVSNLSTGSPALAYLLAEQIPIEQLPLVLGKLQLAYDLFNLLAAEDQTLANFDLLTLWPLLLDNPVSPDRNAWAFGHALLEYWTQGLTEDQLSVRFRQYCESGK